MANRNRPHIFIQRPAIAEAYTRPPRRMGSHPIPVPPDRRSHADRLVAELRDAAGDANARRAQRPTSVEGAVDGVYITFESFPGVDLALQSLDPRQGRRHPELISVQETRTDSGSFERATVFVPDGTLGYFLRRLYAYADTAEEDSPKNYNLIDRIRSVALASVEALWTDPPEQLPSTGQQAWWEVWLRRRDGNEVDRFSAFADASNIRLGMQFLGFTDRVVVLAEATTAQLAVALDVLDDLAELRRPHEVAQLIALESAVYQAEWVEQLADRTLPAPDGAPTVCVIDTGVYQLHPLLTPSLDPADVHACHPSWGLGDHHGHGTEMAGLALFGDFGEAISSANPVRLRHRLESVKLLPPPPRTNPPELYGAVTATAASVVEIQAPARARVFSIACSVAPAGFTVPDRPLVLGQPTSWSAAIDALAAGRSIDVTPAGLVVLDEADEVAPRLFLLSAGNVSVWETDHLARSDVEPIEDPGQAWNALTIGAYTKLDSLDGAAPDWAGWMPLARRGELSPHSRTSVAFGRTWPAKPDVVLEGGNVGRSPAGTDYDTPETLQILTTKAPLQDQRLLTVTAGTSAATAQAANLAASVLADYPAMWPETLRALVVHSAEWTPAMRLWLTSADTRVQRDAFHRRYGMGVPDLARATRSAADALTLVVQDVIHPFDGQGHTREMHLHALPWPTDVLAQLGPVQVHLRITLSYFVEPNPGRRGWARRYSYASHGLRFDVRRATESTDEFRKRINQKALAEEERRPSGDSDSQQWLFGPDQRTAGSLHTDIWTGTAADLARRGVLGIYPVTGWWKENANRDRSDRGARYAVVVSIETPAQDVDIWTPVALEVGVPITIDT
jgi:hypothetical protein